MSGWARRPISFSPPPRPLTCWRAAASGQADDLLTGPSTARCPVVFAPAIIVAGAPGHRGQCAPCVSAAAWFSSPRSSPTGADTGPGRLPEPIELYRVAVRVLARGIAGRRPIWWAAGLWLSAGGTREENSTPSALNSVVGGRATRSPGPLLPAARR